MSDAIRLRLTNAYVRGWRYAVGGSVLPLDAGRNPTRPSFVAGYEDGRRALVEARNVARRHARDACP